MTHGDLVHTPRQVATDRSAQLVSNPRPIPFFRGHWVKRITVEGGVVTLWMRSPRNGPEVRLSRQDAVAMRDAMPMGSERRELSDALLVCQQSYGGER